jgi:hypothetical protein
MPNLSHDNVHDIRLQFVEAWTHYQQNLKLNALEQQIAQVILLHPEYQPVLTPNNPQLQRRYFPELGETNPFLHMGLHLGLREQVQTNRPLGIQSIYNTLCSTYQDPHAAEHALMNCLAEAILLAQTNQTAPDETAYLNACKQLLTSI